MKLVDGEMGVLGASVLLELCSKGDDVLGKLFRGVPKSWLGLPSWLNS